MTATEGRIKPQSISDDVREIEKAMAGLGTHDSLEGAERAVARWESATDPARLRRVLAALTLVQAERDAMQQERDELRAALGEIEWSNDSAWQSQRAHAALTQAASAGGAAS